MRAPFSSLGPLLLLSYSLCFVLVFLGFPADLSVRMAFDRRQPNDNWLPFPPMGAARPADGPTNISFLFLSDFFVSIIGFISLRFGAPSSSSSSFFLSFCLSFFLSFSFSSPPRRSFIDDRSRRQAAFEQVRAATQLRPTCRYNKKKQKRETKPRTHPYLTHPRRKTDSSLIRRFISGNRSACRAYEAGTETNGEI